MIPFQVSETHHNYNKGRLETDTNEHQAGPHPSAHFPEGGRLALAAEFISHQLADERSEPDKKWTAATGQVKPVDFTYLVGDLSYIAVSAHLAEG